ncbi:MAG: hypothetical protein Q6370_006605 [Candidatus Sigynarchaeota archaeon]
MIMTEPGQNRERETTLEKSFPVGNSGAMRAAIPVPGIDAEVKKKDAFDKCLVCKRDLVGSVYICPSCRVAKYHIECIKVLNANNGLCWECKQPIRTSSGMVDRASIEKDILGINEMLVALENQFKQYKLSADTYEKLSNRFLKEKEALEKKLKRTNYR